MCIRDRVKGDGFDFIPKNLTTTGVITPYSTIGVENNSSNQTSEFTVYDASIIFLSLIHI